MLKRLNLVQRLQGFFVKRPFSNFSISELNDFDQEGEELDSFLVEDCNNLLKRQNLFESVKKHQLDKYKFEYVQDIITFYNKTDVMAIPISEIDQLTKSIRFVFFSTTSVQIVEYIQNKQLSDLLNKLIEISSENNLHISLFNLFKILNRTINNPICSFHLVTTMNFGLLKKKIAELSMNNQYEFEEFIEIFHLVTYFDDNRVDDYIDKLYEYLKNEEINRINLNHLMNLTKSIYKIESFIKDKQFIIQFLNREILKCKYNFNKIRLLCTLIPIQHLIDKRIINEWYEDIMAVKFKKYEQIPADFFILLTQYNDIKNLKFQSYLLKKSKLYFKMLFPYDQRIIKDFALFFCTVEFNDQIWDLFYFVKEQLDTVTKENPFKLHVEHSIGLTVLPYNKFELLKELFNDSLLLIIRNYLKNKRAVRPLPVIFFLKKESVIQLLNENKNSKSLISNKNFYAISILTKVYNINPPPEYHNYMDYNSQSLFLCYNYPAQIPERIQKELYEYIQKQQITLRGANRLLFDYPGYELPQYIDLSSYVFKANSFKYKRFNGPLYFELFKVILNELLIKNSNRIWIQKLCKIHFYNEYFIIYIQKNVDKYCQAYLDIYDKAMSSSVPIVGKTVKIKLILDFFIHVIERIDLGQYFFYPSLQRIFYLQHNYGYDFIQESQHLYPHDQLIGSIIDNLYIPKNDIKKDFFDRLDADKYPDDTNRLIISHAFIEPRYYLNHSYIKRLTFANNQFWESMQERQEMQCFSELYSLLKVISKSDNEILELVKKINWESLFNRFIFIKVFKILIIRQQISPGTDLLSYFKEIYDIKKLKEFTNKCDIIGVLYIINKNPINQEFKESSNDIIQILLDNLKTQELTKFENSVYQKFLIDTVE